MSTEIRHVPRECGCQSVVDPATLMARVIHCAMHSRAPEAMEALGGAADEFDRWIANWDAGGKSRHVDAVVQLRNEFRAVLKRAGVLR
jgi:hypothetical protein